MRRRTGAQHSFLSSILLGRVQLPIAETGRSEWRSLNPTWHIGAVASPHYIGKVVRVQYKILLDDIVGSQLVQFRNDDTIIGAFFSFSPDATDLTDSQLIVDWELSFLTTPSYDVNDTAGVLCAGQISKRFLTNAAPTGFATLSEQFSVILPQITVAAGERIYLHIRCSAQITSLLAIAMLYTSGVVATVAARRR